MYIGVCDWRLAARIAYHSKSHYNYFNDEASKQEIKIRWRIAKELSFLQGGMENSWKSELFSIEKLSHSIMGDHYIEQYEIIERQHIIFYKTTILFIHNRDSLSNMIKCYCCHKPIYQIS
jgi:hypothetical protein